MYKGPRFGEVMRDSQFSASNSEMVFTIIPEQTPANFSVKPDQASNCANCEALAPARIVTTHEITVGLESGIRANPFRHGQIFVGGKHAAHMPHVYVSDTGCGTTDCAFDLTATCPTNCSESSAKPEIPTASS